MKGIMRTYDEEMRIAECIIQEARSYAEHSDENEVVILDDYFDELEKLNLNKEDKDLYRARLDFILYTDQF